ncbi:MAG: sensor histidine kinase [Gammaproteobacteria bacterium]
MADLSRLFHTSAIRLTLRYALLYALLTGLALGFLYWTTSRYIDAQMVASLEQEMHHLQRLAHEQGNAAVQRVIGARSEGPKENRRYYLLLSPSGERMAGDLKAWPPTLDADEEVHNIWIEHDLIPGKVEDYDGYWPMIAVSLAQGERLLIAQSVRHAEDLQEYSLTAMVLILAISVMLALAMGIFLGRSVLQRIDTINATARAIAEGSLTRRIPFTSREDEFDELAQHLNAMLDRIEALMASMRQVTDNVAHDLRRPLSRLRNRLEVTLLEARDKTEYEEAMNRAVADADELLHTFNALLKIAQAEGGVRRGDWGEVDMSALAESLGGLYRDQAEEQGLRFTLDIRSDVRIDGNRHLVGQAMSNLLENAFKYTPAGGHITLRVDRYKGRPRLQVCDDGPGIPSECREKVLERFVRLDRARSTRGNGLGLSLVKAVAELHRVQLTLEDNRPGLRVSLVFPVTLPNGKR